MRALKWLYPNLGVKRWFLAAIIGIFLFAVGFAVTNNGVALGYIEWKFKEIVYLATGRTRWTAVPAGIVVSILGALLTLGGMQQMFKAIIRALLPENESKVIDLVYQKNQLKRGPKVVVIGGGTGLSVLLRGLKQYTSNLTAIVTVSDDGGSSGRLRGELGILPPGDIRNCLVALADTENLMDELFSYRFESGDSLAGHNLGNLLIAGMTDIAGDFKTAIDQISKVLAVRGKVLPSTLDNVTLGAELQDGSKIYGESNFRRVKSPIKRVFLQPGCCNSVEEALTAIAEAEAIVLGPGSLYSSVIPNLLVTEIQQALRDASAQKIYVCNVMTEPGETPNYTASQHLKAIIDHCGQGIVDTMIVNTQRIPPYLEKKYKTQGAIPVKADLKKLEKLGIRVFEEDLIYETDLVRHHPEKLAKSIIKAIFRSKTLSDRVTLVDEYLLTRKLRT
ncbi:MAG TPA: gluconeogenesis factor YvcK family protein [Desulfobacteria bacterium]|nr:gluconeogenesis factor YvcK family protein [Desulfobacteria bacterium]